MNMKLSLNHQEKTLTVQDVNGVRVLDLFSAEAFELVTAEWLKLGWNLNYSYSFTWLGLPLIQLPEDIIRIQEVIYRLEPDVIVETGIAHGGSLILYAGLCRLLGNGRVVGVDIEIRPENREAIESHELHDNVTLIEGDSVAGTTVEQVRDLVEPGESVLVILDSCHTKEHVAAELEAYHGLVSPGSYIVATDGIMRDLTGVPKGQLGWDTDNPAAAAEEFAAKHPEFMIEQPPRLFDESGLRRNVTYWPCAYLLRVE